MTSTMDFPPLFKKARTGKVHVWQIWVDPQDDGTAVIRRRHGTVGGAQQEVVEHIKTGKNLGKANATTPLTQAVADAQAEWTKQQARKHYGTDPSGGESAAKRAAAPMLAKKPEDLSKKTVINFDHAYKQPKLDGHRCLATKQDDKVLLVSRTGDPITTVPHIAEVLQRLIPEGETLDGELYTDEIEFEQVSSAITRKQDASAGLSLHIYDIVNPAPYEDRMLLLNDIIGDGVDAVRRVPTLPATSMADVKAYEEECVKLGYEGAMLRWGSYGYEAGARSVSLIKIKTWQDAEFKIASVKEGRATHVGCAIFECFTEAGHPFDVLAPGAMWQKRLAWEQRDQLIGKELTVKYFGYTATAAPVPRFPVGKWYKNFDLKPTATALGT